MSDTPNAIRSIHSQLRKIITRGGHLPSDNAATQRPWLVPKFGEGTGFPLHTGNAQASATRSGGFTRQAFGDGDAHFIFLKIRPRARGSV